MKKLSVAVLFIVLAAACAPNNRLEPVLPDILGTWKLDHTIEEEYQPFNTLIYRDEYSGLPGDSIVIKSNLKIYSYEDGDPEAIEEEYSVINDSTIEIEGEEYKVRKLTASSFYLHQEEFDQNERWIYQIYLKR